MFYCYLYIFVIYLSLFNIGCTAEKMHSTEEVENFHQVHGEEQEKFENILPITGILYHIVVKNTLFFCAFATCI